MAEKDIFKSLFTADCALIVEKSGTISWCNDFAAQLLGIDGGSTVAEIESRGASLFFPDSTTPLRLDARETERIFAGETVEAGDVCLRGARTFGRNEWFRVTAVPVYETEGDGVSSVMILCHDVTARKDAVDRLEKTNGTLSALLEASPLPTLALALDGKITFWNPAAQRVFGWSEDEVLGRPLPFVPEDKREEHHRMREQDLAGGGFPSREVFRKRKDGTTIHLSVSTAPIRDGRGELTGTIALFSDIGERRKMEEQLFQAAKLESLGILAGGVAHDFNNLLTSILGNAAVALDQAKPASPQAKALENILQTVDRAVILTKQMLAYSGRGKFRLRRVNLSALITEMAPLLESSVGARVTLDLGLMSSLPDIDADPGEMQQLVMNLVLNGGEAICGAGIVTVKTYVPSKSDGTPQICLEVTDTGEGMTPDTLQRIFDPFFTTKFTGRGLGLAAVQGIVRGHKGSIEVESAPGKGSRFLVRLPRATEAE